MKNSTNRSAKPHFELEHHLTNIDTSLQHHSNIGGHHGGGGGHGGGGHGHAPAGGGGGRGRGWYGGYGGYGYPYGYDYPDTIVVNDAGAIIGITPLGSSWLSGRVGSLYGYTYNTLAPVLSTISLGKAQEAELKSKINISDNDWNTLLGNLSKGGYIKLG